MTEFNKSNWAKAEFSQEYRDNADIYIVERRRLLEILKSFYKHFLCNKQQKKVLDLGCGDGIITHELFKVDNSISATLVDGSEDMLDKAKERLRAFKNINFIRASFQEILEKNILQQTFDFVVSSLAIHHLTMEEKIALFKKIHSCLNAGGHFMNIDVILAPVENLEHWYMTLWKEWIDERKRSLGIEGNYFDDIIDRYKNNKDNKPDTLEDQMNALKGIGFRNVDCFYKYGIFTIYGGEK
ncbi:MAG: class I SAM-dependent methyltransferase [Nitrospirae bacterium]|nr:class I SAM-dependent methyltransferase [Nitrospirota bacterium]MDA8339319.1 class I SAM-dependent methyltransferase [Nitrospiraceae bacterium]